MVAAQVAGSKNMAPAPPVHAMFKLVGGETDAHWWCQVIGIEDEIYGRIYFMMRPV
jgi:hypothetical protein